MSNEKVPLVAPTVGSVEEQHKKKKGKGYLAYGVVATALCMGFVAHSQAGFFTATPQPEVNLLRSSSTSGCEGWCEDDRSDKHPGGAHSDSTLCAPGDMASLCGGCDFCQPKDDCQDFCESDRGTHTDSQLCGTGFMANQCGGCEFCQSSPSGPKVTDILGTHWADHSDTGGCALPEFDGLYYRDDAIAVGDMRALGSMMIKTEQGHRNCGQLYNIQCTNDVGVEGPVLSSVVVSTCNVEKTAGDCGVDMVDSTWKVATSGMAPGEASCTVELNKSSIFKNYEDMVCSFRPSKECGDCQYNHYYASVALLNTKGKFVVSVTADGNPMRHNQAEDVGSDDGYNQYWDGPGGKGDYNGNSEFVFTLDDGNTHACKYNELRKPYQVHIW